MRLMAERLHSDDIPWRGEESLSFAVLCQKLENCTAIGSTLILWATDMTSGKGAPRMNFLSEIDQPSWPRNGTPHDFLEMLAIAIAATFSPCETVDDTVYWAGAKQRCLRKFLLLTIGVPKARCHRPQSRI